MYALWTLASLIKWQTKWAREVLGNSHFGKSLLACKKVRLSARPRGRKLTKQLDMKRVIEMAAKTSGPEALISGASKLRPLGASLDRSMDRR